MTMFAYPIGTKVRLASGGPEMLAVDIDPASARTRCAWLTESGAREAWFPSICLDIVRRVHVIDDRDAR